MSDERSKKEVVRVERDTVYIERKDSVLVQGSRFQVSGDSLNHHTSAISLTLKWIFLILLAGIVLIVILIMILFQSMKVRKSQLGSNIRIKSKKLK